MNPIRLLLILAVAFSLSSCDRNSGSVSAKELNTFAIRAGLSIPPSATATYHREYRGMDELAHLILEMPMADLDPFMKASALEADIDNTTVTGGLHAKFGDLAPKIPTKFREGQKCLPGDKFLNVLVDEDSPTTAVIYLIWFGV